MENLKKIVQFSKDGDPELEEKLLRPFNYCPKMEAFLAVYLKTFNFWLNIPEDKVKQIYDVNETIVAAFMLVDDIEDNSVLRKGIPVAHSIFGIAHTINAANFALTKSYEKCLALNHPDAIRVYTEGVLAVHRGQGIEIYWTDNYICPSEEEYYEMAELKTGGIMIGMIRLMQLFSENMQDFTKLVYLISLYIQITDDYFSFRPKTKVPNDNFCDDLTEGKFGFPLVHAINNSNEGKSLINILRQKTRDIEVKKHCVSILERCGSFEYTRKKLASLKEEIKEEIANFGSNPFLADYMNIVLDDTLY